MKWDRRNDLDTYLKDTTIDGYENIFKKNGILLRTAESGIYVDRYMVRDCEITFSGTKCEIQYKDPILASAIVARTLASPFSSKRETEISIGDITFKWEFDFLDNSEIVFEKIINLVKKNKIIKIEFNDSDTADFHKQLVFFLEEPHLDDMENFVIEYKRRS